MASEKVLSLKRRWSRRLRRKARLPVELTLNYVKLFSKLQEENKDAKDNTKEEEAVIPVEKERVPVVRGKYYGRYKGDADDSESELSVDDDDSGDANG